MREDLLKSRRYERKYVMDEKYLNQLRHMLKLHPAFFRELYVDRQVNNIYYDTQMFQGYDENVQGVADRVKTRIRWYGNSKAHLAAPVLEYKIKRGLAGMKDSFALGSTYLGSLLDSATLIKHFRESGVPDRVIEDFHHRRPTLINSYQRSYLESADRSYRLTIDRELLYYPVSRSGMDTSRVSRDPSIILEIKYQPEDDRLVSEIPLRWPMRMSKSSKYVRGVELTTI